MCACDGIGRHAGFRFPCFGVWVRVPSGAPRRSKLCIACSDLFCKSERTHVAAPPFHPANAALICGVRETRVWSGASFSSKQVNQKRTSIWMSSFLWSLFDLLRKSPACGGVYSKSRGNGRCAASGGRSKSVSRKRRCLRLIENRKQQCRNGVHPAKASSANIPFFAGNGKLSTFFVNTGQKESRLSFWRLFWFDALLAGKGGLSRGFRL